MSPKFTIKLTSGSDGNCMVVCSVGWPRLSTTNLASSLRVSHQVEPAEAGERCIMGKTVPFEFLTTNREWEWWDIAHWVTIGN